MRGGFFNNINGDRKYNAGHWAEFFAQFIGNGVYGKSASNMQVCAGDGLNVSIMTGSCFINGYHGYADGTDTFKIDYGGAYPRIDRIVIRLDMPGRKIEPALIKGDAAEAPAAPDIVRDGTYYDICIAEIYVAANADVITQADITDTRGDTALCGYVTGVIKQVDTTELFAQYQAAWNDFIAQLGESDKVTINTEDVYGRKLTDSVRMQQSFGSMFTMI